MANPEADCRSVIERLFLYLDGEVAGVDCAEIEAHLEACGHCFGRYGFERELKELVRRTCCERDIPQGLADRIRARLHEPG